MGPLEDAPDEFQKCHSPFDNKIKITFFSFAIKSNVYANFSTTGMRVKKERMTKNKKQNVKKKTSRFGWLQIRLRFMADFMRCFSFFIVFFCLVVFAFICSLPVVTHAH